MKALLPAGRVPVGRWAACKPDAGVVVERFSRTCGQMDRLQARELKALRDENAKLKKLLGEAELDKAALKKLAEGNF